MPPPPQQNCQEEEIILALDIGSSSVRCFAYKYAGNQVVVVAEHSIERKSVLPGSGYIALHDNDEGDFLLDVVDTCIDHVLDELKNNNDEQGDDDKIEYKVVAVGFSTFVMNLIGLDEHGKVVGQKATMSYACQSKLVNHEVEALKSDLGEEQLQRLYKRTGAPIQAAYALTQLRCLYRQQDTDLSQRVHKWQTVASACLCRWTGRTSVPISYSEASWTGLLNVKTCQYEPNIVNLLPDECVLALPSLADYTGVIISNDGDDSSGSDEKLPESIPSMIPQEDGTSIKNEYYQRWPALREARLFLGLGDGACANMGSKCSVASRIACTVGTSAAVRVCLAVTSDLIVEPGLFCYRIDQHHVLVGGALTDGGSVIEWISQLLNLSMSSDEFQQCLRQARELLEEDYDNTDATSSSPTMVPFLSGERSTGFRSGATGAMLGLTRDTTPAHVLKACLEGVTHRLNAILHLILKTMKHAGAKVDEDATRLVCSGKALEVNPLWRQMLADASGLEVLLDEGTREGTSRGVAVLIRHAMNAESSEYDEEPLSDTKLSASQEQGRQYWEKAAASQEALIDAVTPLYGR